jgi:tRNA threonylcarbamoyladenosine biosynthesis protein TsaB
MLVAVEDLCRQAGLKPRDLDFVACGRGPGAFTGVRLGIALAQGFALGADCPVVTISELRALAWKASDLHGWDEVVTMLDARQGEIYRAAYDCAGALPREVMAECLVKPEAVCIPAGDWALAGPGARLVDVKACAVDVGIVPDALAVAQLARHDFGAGLGMAPAAIEPVYLRNRVAVAKVRK